MKTISLQEIRTDCNWQSAFNMAINDCYGEFDMSPILEVITADAGERDGPNWIAVVRLDIRDWARKGFAVMRAGCDYTGWNCIASGKIEFYDRREDCLSPLTLTMEERKRLEIERDILEDLDHRSHTNWDWTPGDKLAESAAKEIRRLRGLLAEKEINKTRSLF